LTPNDDVVKAELALEGTPRTVVNQEVESGSRAMRFGDAPEANASGYLDYDMNHVDSSGDKREKATRSHAQNEPREMIDR